MTKTITGTAGNDILDAIDDGHCDNDIFGLAGNDTLYGWDGDDYLDGGDGHDTLYGENGDDVLDGWNGDDLLYGDDGDDILYGWDGHDELHGGSGDDELYGEAGNDTLTGYGYTEYEYDTLTGGAGADTFVIGDAYDVFYQSSSFEYGYATIEDFDYLEGDKIQVHGSYSNYTVKDVGNDAEIYHNSNSSDLVAIVKGGAGANLIPSLDFVSA